MQINVIELNGEFELRTDRGNVLGQRLITVSPPEGKQIPEVPDKPFKTRSEAASAALRWNLYLRHAYEKRKKRK